MEYNNTYTQNQNWSVTTLPKTCIMDSDHCEFNSRGVF